MATSRTDAREKIKEILDDLEERNGKSIDGARMTFVDLAKHFETHYIKEAGYDDYAPNDGEAIIQSSSYICFSQQHVPNSNRHKPLATSR